VGQHAPKSLKICYPEPIVPNFIEIGETTLEKSVTKYFYILQYFGSQGDPKGPNVTGVCGGVHQPPLATCKILSRSDNPSPRYLLPNFVDFVAGVMYKKRTVRYVTALHAATITNTLCKFRIFVMCRQHIKLTHI